MKITKSADFEKTIDKNMHSFKALNVHVYLDFLKDFDLMIIMSDLDILLVKIKFEDESIPQLNYVNHNYRIENYFLDRKPKKPQLIIYMITSENMFTRVYVEHRDVTWVWSTDYFFDLPIEVKSLDVLVMKRLPHTFIFVLNDTTTSSIYICLVDLVEPHNISSFFIYEMTRESIFYYIFDSKNPKEFYISSNTDALFFELIVHEKAKLQITFDVEDSYEYSLYLTARNNFYSKEIILFGNDFNNNAFSKTALVKMLRILERNWFIFFVSVMMGLLLVFNFC